MHQYFEQKTAESSFLAKTYSRKLVNYMNIHKIIKKHLEEAYTEIMKNAPSGDITPEQIKVIEDAEDKIAETMLDVFSQNR